MAGDWIKVEHATPDKPEVGLMASMLKIDQDSVVGKLLRVWMWADKNSIDGNAVCVTFAFLDRLVSKRGFAKAMLAAGWLSGEENALVFPGFGRHNGTTAKARAETNRRVANHRECNANVTEKPLPKPLPEKRREEYRETYTQPQALEAVPAPCTEEEAWRYAQSLGMSFTREGITLWHSVNERNGWTIARSNGAMQPITDWRAALRSSVPWVQAELSKSNSKTNGNNRSTHRQAPVVTRNTAPLPANRPSLNATAARGIPDKIPDAP